MYLKFLIVFSLLLFYGCEDKIVTKIYDHESVGKKIKKLRISTNAPAVKDMAIDVLKQREITVSDDGTYTMEISAKDYERHCNNPVTPAYEATYDGYVIIRLLKNLKPVISLQRDYHGKFNEEILSSLVDEMIKKMKM